MRYCPKCDEETERYKSGDCKLCARRRGRKYYVENKDAVYRRYRKWIKAHPEKEAEYGKRYRDAHPGEATIRQAEWRRKNPEKSIATMHRYQARKKNAGGSVSGEEWKLVLEFYGKCLICGATDDLTMDHIIPLSKGGDHAVDNIQVLCLSCNCGKCNRDSVDYRLPGQIEEVTRLLEEQWQVV